MTDKTGGPAFPQHDTDARGFVTEEPGMTLRDYFAAKALQGMLSRSDYGVLDFAGSAYSYADAMLKEREK